MVFYQSEYLLATLREFDETNYPPEACKIRDVFELIVEKARDRLWELTQKAVPDDVDEAWARELGRLLHDIFSFLRFLQASDPRRTPPAIQAALTDLTKLFFSAALPGDSRVTLVRPQWEYNATYRALTWDLRDMGLPALLDPGDEYDAASSDDLIAKLANERAEKEKASSGNSRFTQLPKHIAVISFAGLDGQDVLLLPLLCHELGHFIDYTREAPPIGSTSNKDKYMLVSESKGLRKASHITLKQFKDKIDSLGGNLTSVPEEVLNDEYTSLQDRIAKCRREILADLLAVRMSGLAYFFVLSEFLKSLDTWPEESVTPHGYPGIACRLRVVLEELQTAGLIGILDDLVSKQDNAIYVYDSHIREYVRLWDERIDEAESNPQYPAFKREEIDSVIKRASSELAAAAIPKVLPRLQKVARKFITNEQSAIMLTATIFDRVSALKNDIPPSLPGDTIDKTFADILGAAWVYQISYGIEKENAISDKDQRFSTRQQTRRLTAKAIELAALLPPGLVNEQSIPQATEPPIPQRWGVCAREDILTRMKAPEEANRLIIVPHFPKCVQAGSLDVHLGHWFKIPKRAKLPSINLANREEFQQVLQLSQEEVFIGKSSYLTMHPGDLVLGTTLEFVALPSDIIAFVEGKSQLGRRGLIVATATQVAPGFHGVVVLELINSGMLPLQLAPGMEVAQIIFQTMTAPTTNPYRGSSYCQIRP